jgi:hypothetical protein
MPASQLVNARHGIIARNAVGDAAGLVVQTAILVRRSMEPTGRGAASNIGQPIPTVGVLATTTLSEGASIGRRSEDAGAHELKASPLVDWNASKAAEAFDQLIVRRHAMATPAHAILRMGHRS